jgi:Phosphoenolpyruvate synthase/pyruvate phosphate dikinase
MEGDDLNPVTNSGDIARLLSAMPLLHHDNEKRNLDYWDRLFMNAAEICVKAQQGDLLSQQSEEMIFERICRLVIGRDERILALAHKYLSLKDLLDIKTRLIGSGFIGGKAVGMLLARSILNKADDFDWKSQLEPHDSFYVGSDVFYSYLVQNGWWKLRMQQRSKTGYFEVAKELKEKILSGAFPDSIRSQFQQMLEYFGQSPIIIRSSSLLEDAFGNAFAGKYSSEFCVNQGTTSQRYSQFEDAIRKVFASTMNEEALSYRLQRGLDLKDEQMAILVQRVSGSYHNHYFFPDLAGVGISYNTYVWNNNMNPTAGMLRLVYGLGTHAVDRVEGDYPRIVALDAPLLRPQAGEKDIRKYSQHDVDVLNIETNKWETVSLSMLLYENKDKLMKLIGIRDQAALDAIKNLGLKGYDPWILTFDRLLSETSFTNVMQKMLKTIEGAYEYPVDLEFTANFNGNEIPSINLVQCRPLQVKGMKKHVAIPKKISREKIVFQAVGNFMGGNISQTIDRIIYVVPHEYVQLDTTQKYEVANIIGRLNKQCESREMLPVMLMGPGRWGTSTPSLGVPVKFSDINNIAVLVELAFSDAGLMPELSFGSHFFQDLVETDIFYAALFPEKEETIYNESYMNKIGNSLTGLLPEKDYLEKAIKVYDLEGKGLMLLADIVSQKIICYFDDNVHTP